MGKFFYQSVVSVGDGLPLAARRLVPEGHDGSALLDHQGIPLNTSISTLHHIDEVRFFCLDNKGSHLANTFEQCLRKALGKQPCGDGSSSTLARPVTAQIYF